MTHKERFTSGLEFYPKLVEDAHIWAEAGMAEGFTIIIPTDDPENPDEVALETARRVEALGGGVRYEQTGKRYLIFFGALPSEEVNEDEEVED